MDKPLLVRGTVIDSLTGKPIPNAIINLLDVVDGSAVALNSDMNGAFELNLPHGEVVPS